MGTRLRLPSWPRDSAPRRAAGRSIPERTSVRGVRRRGSSFASRTGSMPVLAMQNVTASRIRFANRASSRPGAQPLSAPAARRPQHLSAADRRPVLRHRPPQGRKIQVGVSGGAAVEGQGLEKGGEGGGGGGRGGGGDSGSGGGRGDGGGGRGDSAGGGFGWKGWQDRVAFDPEFPFKVLVEQVIGVGAAVLGDMSSRKDWGIHELDFVFSTIVVGSIMNFSLMYFLAGTPASASRAGGNIVAKLFDENTLKGMGAPGGSCFEAGFPLGKRLVNLGYKGAMFGLVGFTAGVIGTSLSNTLIALRKRMDPSYEAQNESPEILPNACVWATHMGVSSNVRYQLLNGLDLALQPRMGGSIFKAFSTIIRLANNIVGGMSFVTLAKLANVQKSDGD